MQALLEKDEKGGSSNDENEDESDEKTEKKQTNLGVINEELKLGEQLQDDIINHFCDKLQAKCPKRIDGLMAIQFVTCEPENLKKHISGQNETAQIIYDRARLHYVLTHFDPVKKLVTIWDSLQIYHEELPHIDKELRDYIRNLYGHLFRSEIDMAFDRCYERQHDDFSCGYRSIGALVDLCRGSNPATKHYSRRAIFEFLQQILRDPNPTWEMFKNAKLHHGGERNIPEDSMAYMYLQIKVKPKPLSNSATTSTSAESTVHSNSTATSRVSSNSSIDQNNNRMSTESRNFAGHDHEINSGLYACSEESQHEEFQQIQFSPLNSPNPVVTTQIATTYANEDALSRKSAEPRRTFYGGLPYVRREMFSFSALKRVFNSQSPPMLSRFDCNATSEEEEE